MFIVVLTSPEGYRELSFVCLRPDGAIETPGTVGIMCRQAKKKVPGLEDFHFHMLRHTFTSNLLSNGAAPKDVDFHQLRSYHQKSQLAPKK